jgi:tRNA threonylcarbamoyladenosine biosynthesis protein TsaE
MRKISKNLKETKQIAQIFVEEILNKDKQNKNALVVGLVGDLGAGKTAFLQAVAKHLGIKNKVLSPTFVIMKKYSLPKRVVCKSFMANKTKPVSAGENFYKQPAFKFLFHLDAYRLKNEKELLYLGWEEIIKDDKNLIFIEWPENVSKVMPKHTKYIHIFDQKDGQKVFKFK